ncbi:MAG: hypothetical protein M5R36_11485 [Deltaproteobacteria bacterium]|nr:hypothetical protein [Deltaproteobacteria bacterium]
MSKAGPSNERDAAARAAASGAPEPSWSTAGLARCATHPEAAFLFSPAVLPRLALLAGASPWAIELAWDHLADVLRCPPAHVLGAQLREAQTPEDAAALTGLSARTIAAWRGLLLARAALFRSR